MKKNNTQKLVFGAMMLALFTLIIVFDTFTGTMFNVFFYYLMPVPFVVYGVKYDIISQGLVGFCACIMSFLFGLPETILFSVSAICSSMIISYGINHKLNGIVVYSLTTIITVIGQLLSITLLAGIIGYDLMAEIHSLSDMLTMFRVEDITKVYFIATALIGFMESYLMIFFVNLVLYRLKMPYVPKISVLLLHLPKWVGLLCVIGIASQKLEFVSIGLLLLIIQGFSFSLLICIEKKLKPMVRVLMLLLCFVPYVNYLFATLGLFDIFSEKRKQIMYNMTL